MQLNIKMSKHKEHCYLEFNLKAGQIHADFSNYLLKLATNHVFHLHNVCHLFFRRRTGENRRKQEREERVRPLDSSFIHTERQQLRQEQKDAH